MSCYQHLIFSDLNMVYKHRKIVSIIVSLGEESETSANFCSTEIIQNAYLNRISVNIFSFYQQKLQSQEAKS